MPEVSKLPKGTTYEEVVRQVGREEDGTLSAEALLSYDRHRYSGLGSVDFRSIEERGGRHLFWLSRSECHLVFNVVSFDAANKVTETYFAESMHLGFE